MSKPRMTPAERRATASLASIFGLRMLRHVHDPAGLRAVRGDAARRATPHPDRLALGAYGLTQALLQIPFGWASDSWGRKPVIYSGLVVFAIGSFVAACGARHRLGRSSAARCRARAPFPRR